MTFDRVACHLASVALLTISVGSRAEASFILNLNQSGSDVVGTGSGTLNITALTFESTNPSTASVVLPAAGVIGLSGGLTGIDDYAGISGPTSFGSGGLLYGSSGAGDEVGIVAITSGLVVPTGYLSGAALSDSGTWASTTLAGLGLTSGSYVYTWGSGATADSFTLNIDQDVAATPEPGSVCLLGFGFSVLMLGWSRKRIVLT